MQLGRGELSRKDVKNEGWSDYVLENTGSSDKMYIVQPGFLDEKCTDLAINRGESGVLLKEKGGYCATLNQAVSVYARSFGGCANSSCGIPAALRPLCREVWHHQSSGRGDIRKWHGRPKL